MTGEGDAQQEQSDPSSGDCPMGEVQETAPVTGEGVVERPFIGGSLGQSRGVGMKEHVREHLERELAKKKNKEPPSRSALYLEAVRQAQEVNYKEYVASIPFTNNFEKNDVPDADV